MSLAIKPREIFLYLMKVGDYHPEDHQKYQLANALEIISVSYSDLSLKVTTKLRDMPPLREAYAGVRKSVFAKELTDLLADGESLTLRQVKNRLGKSRALPYVRILYEYQGKVEKALEKAKRRYAQGGIKSLREYLHRWRTWLYKFIPLMRLFILLLIK